MDKQYRLCYLPLFDEDLGAAYEYISQNLKNPAAADSLVKTVRTAIQNRLSNPTGFSPYESSVELQDEYFRINVGNYSVFYVAEEDIMEVRRLIYSRRNLSKLL
jgi:plasmid stabilization system protein ParE